MCCTRNYECCDNTTDYTLPKIIGTVNDFKKYERIEKSPLALVHAHIETVICYELVVVQVS